MPQTVTFRIVVRDPLPGVELRLQRGRDELVPPVERTAEATTFEFRLDADVGVDGGVRLRGPEVQGPREKRFVYVNAGTYAGQHDSPWGVRAKVPLTGLRAAVAAASGRPGVVIEGTIDGRGRGGGPAAATVALLGGGWEVVPA